MKPKDIVRRVMQNDFGGVVDGEIAPLRDLVRLLNTAEAIKPAGYTKRYLDGNEYRTYDSALYALMIAFTLADNRQRSRSEGFNEAFAGFANNKLRISEKNTQLIIDLLPDLVTPEI